MDQNELIDKIADQLAPALEKAFRAGFRTARTNYSFVSEDEAANWFMAAYLKAGE